MLSKFEKIIVLIFALGTVYMVSVNAGQQGSQPSVQESVESVGAHRLG